MPRPSWKPCVSCLACAMSQDAKRRAGRHRRPLFPPRRHRPRRAAPFFLLLGSRVRAGTDRVSTVPAARSEETGRGHLSGHTAFPVTARSASEGPLQPPSVREEGLLRAGPASGSGHGAVGPAVVTASTSLPHAPSLPCLLGPSPASFLPVTRPHQHTSSQHTWSTCFCLHVEEKSVRVA